MYSEALAVADRNTVRLMIDDMQEEITAMSTQLSDMSKKLTADRKTIATQAEELSAKDKEITELKTKLAKFNPEQ